MVQLGVDSQFAADPRVKISEVQITGEAGYATVDLLSYFKKARPDVELLVVIGAELVPDLPTWREAETLKKSSHLLVVRRPGAPEPSIPSGWKATTLLQPYSGEVAVSSTELRRRMAVGESLLGLVPGAVREYCDRNGLYKGG